MKNRPKQCSVMLLVSTILVAVPLVACEPEWCDDKWTDFTNVKYGYTVWYPTSCSLMYGDSVYSHNLHIFFGDGWSEVTVTVYSSLDSDSVESLFYAFKDDILAATEEGDDNIFFKRYDYEILRSWEGEEFFPEIHYTFTAARADFESGGWEETDMRGETWWCMGTYRGTEYIYSCTYETLAGCEECIWVCSELSQDFFNGVYDNPE